jgi:hypothetical protein
MKQDDVRIGGEYMTRVAGGGLVRVRVLGEYLDGRATSRRRFRVARVSAGEVGKALPKPRTAAALHVPRDYVAPLPPTLDGSVAKIAAAYASGGIEAARAAFSQEASGLVNWEASALKTAAQVEIAKAKAAKP